MHLSKESKILCFLTWLPMKASRLRFVHEKFNFTLEELLFLSKWINIHFLFNWNYNNEVNWQVSEKKTIEMTGSSLTLCSYFFTQLFYSTATGGCFWQLLLTDISCGCFADVPTQLLYSAPTQPPPPKVIKTPCWGDHLPTQCTPVEVIHTQRLAHCTVFVLAVLHSSNQLVYNKCFFLTICENSRCSLHSFICLRAFCHCWPNCFVVQTFFNYRGYC